VQDTVTDSYFLTDKETVTEFSWALLATLATQRVWRNLPWGASHSFFGAITRRKWNMKRFVLIGLAILVITSLTAPVFAWELSMKGETEWRYRYWTRTGNEDIFGTMGGAVNLAYALVREERGH
jgi:hypothetical protein